MKCREEGCEGEISKNNPIHLQSECFSHSFAYSCKECGRLYWRNGSFVVNRSGHKVFLENGKVVCKDENSQLIKC